MKIRTDKVAGLNFQDLSAPPPQKARPRQLFAKTAPCFH